MKNSTITATSNHAQGKGRWASAALWTGAWVLAFFAVGEPLLLPSPWAVGISLAKLIFTLEFWTVTAGSLLRILAGFLLGLAAGAVLAAIASAHPAIKSVIGLPMNIIKATPVASFVILALLFIKGRGFSMFIAFLMVLPLSWSNILEGLGNTDSELLEMARVYRFTRRDVMRYIYVPSIFPYLISAARVGMGFAWKAGIAGEVIAIPAGTIGTQLYNAKVHLDTADLFAWTVVIILLSLVLERATMSMLELLTPARRIKGGHKL